MKVLIYPFIILAASGFVLSLVMHLFSLFGIRLPGAWAVLPLFVGIFIVWLPTIVLSQQLTKDFKQGDFWKAALRGCPAWMRYMFFGVGIYAVVNFIMFISISSPPGKANAPLSPTDVRGFSGHLMVFYFAAFSVLYSWMRTRERDVARRCPRGHPVSASARHCETCGEKVLDDSVE